ncbi:HNH endonuclease [Dickeya oryzae]|uniref:HNH endonuclease n=1 Tax=Dickeya oryzae TaxID=1240404 RepID=A0AB39IQL4_9GAMM|nr:hypothetical protein [Dickeya oryzae]MCA6990233.1 hypothetical protein [Dickeya oryzae]
MSQFLISSLTDFLLVDNFNQLRSAMQAELVPPLPTNKIEEILNPIQDPPGHKSKPKVEGKFFVGENGERVIIYKREPSYHHGQYTLPKYHIANCSTLKEMWTANRSKNYIRTSRSDGLFVINNKNSDTGEIERNIVRLKVCKLCLELINWDDYKSKTYTEKNMSVDEFDLEAFFEKYPTSATTYRPEKTDNEITTNDYPENFDEISINYRSAKNWRCEACNTDLSAERRRRFLHVHHRNGQKNENQHSNLQALCIECHAQQPHHEHMRNHLDLSLFLKEKSVLTGWLKAAT